MAKPRDGIEEKKLKSGEIVFYGLIPASLSPTGRKNRIKFEAKNRKEAAFYRMEHIRRLRASSGKKVAPETLFKDWLPFYLASKKEGKSRLEVESKLKMPLEYFGKHSLKDINAYRVGLYRNWRGEHSTRQTAHREPSEQVKVSDATINREIANLKAAIKAACYENPDIPLPIGFKMPSERGRIRKVAINEDEFERILEALPEPDKGIALFAWETGRRFREILILQWKWIDFENNRINVPPEITKTKDSQPIPMTERLREYLFERRSKSSLLHLSMVFHRYGRPVKGIRKAWKSACRRAGLEGRGFRFHDIRHCFYRECRKAGLPQWQVMKMIGHKTLSMAMRYDTVTVQDREDGFRKLEQSRKEHAKEHRKGNDHI